MIERHVRADLGGLADHHAHAVINEHPIADAGAGMDLDAGQDAADMADEPAHQQPAVPPGPVAQAVEQQCVKSRIAQDNLDPRPRRGIAFHDRRDVLT